MIEAPPKGVIDAMDIYARLQAEGDNEDEHSLRLAVTAFDIEINTGAGTVTLAHEDFDQVARLVNRCRAAWSRLATETEAERIDAEQTDRRNPQ